MNDTLQKKIVDYIVHLLEPTEIILFGSYASGMQRNNSDIDLLIVTERMQNRQHLKNDISSFLLQFGYSSDIILMSKKELQLELSVEKKFLFNAIKISQKIYKKDHD